MIEILVLGPSGAPLAPAQSYAGNPAIFQIATTGTYTILLEGENTSGPTASVAYTLTAYVDPAPVTVAFAAVTSGTLVNQNAIARYTFTLASDSNVVFNSLTANSNENWTLTGPNGYSLTRNFYDSGSYELGGTNPILALKAGTYTLTFSNSSTASAAYSFQLLNVANATPLTVGTTLSATDNPGNATLLYSFNATQGTPLSLTTVDASNVLSVRVFDPYGQQVFGPTATGQQLITPTATGVYTLMVEGRVFNTAPQPFSVTVNSVPAQSFALTGPNGLNGPVGPFSEPGEIGDALAFTGMDSIQVADQPAIAPGASFTLQAWINPDFYDQTNDPIISKSGGQNYTYAIGINNGGQVWLQFSDANDNNLLLHARRRGAAQHLDAGDGGRRRHRQDDDDLRRRRGGGDARVSAPTRRSTAAPRW